MKIQHSIESKVPAVVVFDWWTDLKEGEIIEGGKNLRSIKVLSREGDTITVETEWSHDRRSYAMKETLVRDPPSYSWTVKPEGGAYPLDIFDKFRLEPLDHQPGSRLYIESQVKGRGLLGKLLLLFMGWKVKQTMTDEWDYAIKSLEAEGRSARSPEQKQEKKNEDSVA